MSSAYRPFAALLLLSAFTLSGCVTAYPGYAPCYAGWTTDESGSSTIWSPPADDLEAIKRELIAGHRLVCIHKMPSGDLVVLSNSRHGVETTHMEPGQTGGFTVLERGIIVGGGPRF